jgi:hypothetical protein
MYALWDNIAPAFLAFGHATSSSMATLMHFLLVLGELCGGMFLFLSACPAKDIIRRQVLHQLWRPIG